MGSSSDVLRWEMCVKDDNLNELEHRGRGSSEDG